MSLTISYHGSEPEKARERDAAYDLRAKHSYIIPPGCRQLVETGTRVAIPSGHVGLVCSRSGLAFKQGVFVLNAPGVIDPDYTGDVGVILQNSGTDKFVVNAGDRIAQLLVQQVAQVSFLPVDELESAERSAAGFGSSGVA